MTMLGGTVIVPQALRSPAVTFTGRRSSRVESKRQQRGLEAS